YIFLHRSTRQKGGMTMRGANILLVEDNEGDVELTQIAFEHGNLSSQLTVANDGVDALDCLLGRGKYPKPTIPDLILLDLNMPRMGGKEFLGVVKQDEALKSIPIIVFTSSNADKDVAESYRLH